MSLIDKVKANETLLYTYQLVGSAIIRFIRLFIKTDNKLILFVSYGGRYYNDSPRCIYEKMLVDPRFKDYKMVWAFRNPDDYESNINKVKIDTPKYYITALKARCWVTNVVIERGLDFTGKNTFYFHTTHGILPKLTGYDSKEKMTVANRFVYKYDFSIAQTEYDKNVQPQMYGLRLDQIEACGFPKNDVLAQVKPSDTMRMRQKLNIPEGKKVILYAPTFRGDITGTMDCPVDFKLWNKVLGDEYIVLYRAHPVMANIAHIDSSSGFVFDVSKCPNNNDLMIASDILISDYSGIFFEFGVLGREMYCFAYDYEEYSKSWGLYFDIRKELPGGFLEEKQLLEYIKEGDRNEINAILALFDKKYINHNTNSSQRCVDIIYNHIS